MTDQTDHVAELFLDPTEKDRFKEIFDELMDHDFGINEARVFAKKAVVTERIRAAKSLDELKAYVAMFVDPYSRW